jgi:uncharacterized protein YkwD
MNGIAMFLGLLIVQIPTESLGPVENIYTIEYGNVQGRKILNGEYAGQYRIEGQVQQTEEQLFLNLVNQHRANHGLPPVGWSQEAANMAATNNAVHAPHSIFGRQNWASVGDFVSAFNLWVASPPHNAMLLGINTAIGVARCVTGCTANGY